MKLKTITKQYRLALMSMAMLSLGSLTYALVSPNTSEASAEVATVVGPGGYTLTISSSTGNLVEMNITPTAAGNLKMGEEILTTSTTATSGYQLYIGMNSNSNSLYLNGDSSSTTLPAQANTATYASPTSLSNNSWGYAIPQTYTNKSTGSTGTQTPGTDVASNNGFNAGTYIDGGTDGDNTKWAAVPTQGNEQLLQSTDSATSNKALHVFYGAKINTTQTAGVYTGTVVYTAVAGAPERSMVSVSPSVLTNLYGGDTLTITLGVNTAYSANFLTNSTITIGTESCTPTGGGNNASGELYLTCTAPAQSLSGRYDVQVNLSDGSNNYGTYTAVNGIEYKTDGGSGGDTDSMTVSPILASANRVNILALTIPLSSSEYHTHYASSVTVNSVTIGGQTCSSPYTLITNGNLYRIVCDTPSLSIGNYDIEVAVTGDGTTYNYSYKDYQVTDGLPFFTIGFMQDMTASVCNSVVTPNASVKTNITENNGTNYITDGSIIPSTTLIDLRDDQVYTVRKLADGNCWMTENLRFGAQPDTSATPNVSPEARPWNSTSDPNLTDTTTASNINKLTTDRISNASGCGSNFSNSGTNFTTPSICTYQANTAASYDGGAKFGVLYNYCAATGGTVCNSSIMSADAAGSVCPKGWKLPGLTANPTGSGADTSGTTKTYDNLANSYGYGNNSTGSTGMFSSPLNFVRAGRAYNGSLNGRSSSGYGYYWLPTKHPSGTNYVYYLYLDASNVKRDDGTRYDGRSLRCVSAS